MQTVVQVICTAGPSLREAIISDLNLDDYSLRLQSYQKRGRSPGWAKLHGTGTGDQGAVNLEWDNKTTTLVCRVINKGKILPTKNVLGNFIVYLLSKHNRRIKAIVVSPK